MLFRPKPRRVQGQTKDLDDTLRGQPVVLHERGPAVGVLQPVRPGSQPDHGTQQAAEDALRFLFRRVCNSRGVTAGSRLPQLADRRREAGQDRLGPGLPVWQAVRQRQDRRAGQGRDQPGPT